MSPDAKQKSEDLLVISPVKAFTCADCGSTEADLMRLEDDAPHCLECVDLDHLVFLPSGNTALTRRARKASTLSAVVIRWSRARKRYERQGVLVEQPALELAEVQCLADEDVRARQRERAREKRALEDVDFQQRMAVEIARLFPRCPADRAEAIAKHAGTRSSGRVGRSAAGRALEENAVTLAVVASVRHQDTRYDNLLMAGIPRAEARNQIRSEVDEVLDGWRG
ncbi:hypothetical protein EV644_13629 [Kribbella orskensis]|uniref:DUF2293 domain-containing protein n=1 Tax=Kribbella orskensis TaxID=2512216 RepID=A0ABY2B7Q9_9ACTN|nr:MULTISPECIES: DUF2293 domain-containing protein [Kribbella]TCN29981.1 hypothetical protein EV642_13822 [Kribbella sp. VKM Ac-2500]TCO10107.1 hypothetical protein EV644_13629 [Kribbella orskensis]